MIFNRPPETYLLPPSMRYDLTKKLAHLLQNRNNSGLNKEGKIDMSGLHHNSRNLISFKNINMTNPSERNDEKLQSIANARIHNTHSTQQLDTSVHKFKPNKISHNQNFERFMQFVNKKRNNENKTTTNLQRFMKTNVPQKK